MWWRIKGSFLSNARASAWHPVNPHYTVSAHHRLDDGDDYDDDDGDDDDDDHHHDSLDASCLRGSLIDFIAMIMMRVVAVMMMTPVILKDNACKN